MNRSEQQVIVSPEPDLLTVTQVLAALSIGRTCYYELVADGELLPIRIGKRHLLPRAEKERFINKRLEAARAAQQAAA